MEGTASATAADDSREVRRACASSQGPPSAAAAAPAGSCSLSLLAAGGLGLTLPSGAAPRAAAAPLPPWWLPSGPQSERPRRAAEGGGWQRQRAAPTVRPGEETASLACPLALLPAKWLAAALGSADWARGGRPWCSRVSAGGALPTRQRPRSEVLGAPQSDESVWHARHGQGVSESAGHDRRLRPHRPRVEHAQAAVAFGCRVGFGLGVGSGGGKQTALKGRARGGSCGPGAPCARCSRPFRPCWETSAHDKPPCGQACTSGHDNSHVTTTTSPRRPPCPPCPPLLRHPPDQRRTVPSAAALTNRSARSSPERGLPGGGAPPSAPGSAANGCPTGLMPAMICAVGLRGLPGEMSCPRSGWGTDTDTPDRERMSSV